MPEPRGGMVRLTPSRGSDLTLILMGPPDRGGGVGGWETAERALRRPGKWWKQFPDDTISLDCLLDIDAIGGPSVERRLRVLRDMGLATDEDDPPTIELSGDIWDSDQNITWVMSNLTLGDRLFQPDGSLRRQAVKVDLERFTEIDDIKAIRLKTTRSKKGARKRRVVRTRAHDTLRAVALRELGDPTRWKDLRRWNKKVKSTDPDIALRTGTQLVIRK